ncbi:MAG: four helix bundle protein [Candidatus Chisholmbacteria bacterium]|nr:four helix bundle protein [Candidatus Chisholmbacteria bacterium]
MQDYRKLQIWQRSMDFAVKIYRFTAPFPSEERFGLVNQIRRSASSICLNIAEGCGGNSSVVLGRYLKIALGSLYETKTGLELSIRLNFGKKQNAELLLAEAEEIGAMLASFLKRTK